MRHHGGGPSKKLAPAARPGVSCPHEFREEEGVQLEVECISCPGAHDLGNPRCLSGVVEILSEGAQPETIVLRRYIHKRYRGESVRRVRATASMLASINRRLRAFDAPSDRRCRTCPASTDGVMARARRMLLSDPEGFSGRAAVLRSEVEVAARGTRCQDADRCASKAVSFLTANGGGL